MYNKMPSLASRGIEKRSWKGLLFALYHHLCYKVSRRRGGRDEKGSNFFRAWGLDLGFDFDCTVNLFCNHVSLGGMQDGFFGNY